MWSVPASSAKVKILHMWTQAIELDARRRHLVQQGEALKSRKNTVSQQVAAMKAKKEDATAVIAEMRVVADEIKALDEELRTVEENLRAVMLQIPNLPDASVPDGKTPADNKPIAHWGEPPVIDFTPKPHWDLIKSLGLIDFDRGTKITGAGFPVYVGKGARLERALISFFLDHATAAGYTELLPPLMVNAESATGTGQLPDKEGQMYVAPAGRLLSRADRGSARHEFLPRRDPQRRAAAGASSARTHPVSGARPDRTARTCAD